jgi:hypothetical protein
MSARANQWIFDYFRAQLAGREAEAPALGLRDELAVLLKQYQLESMCYLSLKQQLGDDPLVSKIEKVWQARMLTGCRQVEVARTILRRFEEAACPMLAMRGPFAAMYLYGDVAARRFSDLDFYVPRGQVDQAWKIFHELGYQLRNPEMPRGFFLRNHLHWNFVNRTTGSSVDLHWALDHPFTPLRVEYSSLFEDGEAIDQGGLTWLQPEPGRHLIVQCLHLLKHRDDALALVRSGEAQKDVLASGCVQSWIDIAYLIHRDGARWDWQEVLRRAQAWHALEALAAGLEGASRLFGVDVPDFVSIKLAEVVSRPVAPAVRPSRLVQSLATYGDFHATRSGDWKSFVFPPESYFEATIEATPARSRVVHAAQAITRLGTGAIDGLACLGVAKTRRALKRSGRSSDKCAGEVSHE